MDWTEIAWGSGHCSVVSLGEDVVRLVVGLLLFPDRFGAWTRAVTIVVSSPKFLFRVR